MRMNPARTLGISLGLEYREIIDKYKEMFIQYQTWEEYLYNMNIHIINQCIIKKYVNTKEKENKIETYDLTLCFMETKNFYPIIVDKMLYVELNKNTKKRKISDLELEKVKPEDFEYFN